ncbi:MFS transporter [Saccharothrix variisporea]|uniref:Putative MFS family arabinose efflux permease n=1 Tax=Saccharothrix variisporea TaxID=543527 RepID=A0A495X3M6_9PSEU|nr:MFS transporter [Saccharothrix variisporea]RKT68497.1 putative MFS family arabinose efflux permease [Saccharothrix variisporea]
MRRFPLPVRLLLVNQFGVNTGFYLLIPYLATHLGDVGLSAAATGVVLGVRTLSQQGLFLLGGSASDRLGPRRVIIAGCALRTVGFGLFAIGDTMTVLLAASVLSGLAGALFNPAVRAYIAEESDDRVGAFALFNVYGQAGALAGPLLGSVLLLWDFRVSALVAAGIFAVLTVAQALVLPARDVPPHRGTVLDDWRESLADKRFLAFTVALTGMFVLQNQLYLVLPLEVERVTGSARAVAAVFLVSTVATLLLQVRVTRWFERMPRGRAIAVGMAVMGLGFTATALSHVWAGLLGPLTAAFFLSLGVMIAHPFVYELIPAFGRTGLSGTYFGVFYLVSGLAATVGNAGVGWVFGVSGTAASLVCVAVGLACAAAVLWLHRRGVLSPTREVAR